MIAKKLKVTGDVQGVFYRHNAKKEAKIVGVSGWTKNEHDGSVTIVVQGGEEAVQNFIEWSRGGSPIATVENVVIEETEIDSDMKGFKIK